MSSIVIVIDQYLSPYAGTESQVFKLAQGLSERGYKVRLAVFRESEYIRCDSFPVPTDVLGIESITSPKNFLRLYRYARKLNLDKVELVHFFFNDCSIIGPPMFRAAGLRCLISRRDMGFWYTTLHRRLLPWTGLFVDSVICNSRAVAEVTRRVERFPERKVAVIYNGYPELEVHGEEELKSDGRNDSSSYFIVGLVANVRPIKRIEDLIRASLELVSADIPFEVHIIGGGDTTPIQQEAQSFGIEERVVFWGSREDVPERIKEFDVAVLCSESEGFSNSIIEYMRAGKPVVCTNAGGNPEIVEHGVTGYLYPVGDTAALGRHLVELAQSPDKRKEMGRRGLERVQADYTIDRMLDEHQALYEQVIGKGRESNA